MSTSDSRKVSNSFVRACAEGRHAEVMLMIAAGQDVNQFDMGLDEGGGWRGTDGHEPNSLLRNGVQMAIRNHDLKLLEILDEAGVDFDFMIDGHNAYKDDRGQVQYPRGKADVLAMCVDSGFLDGVKFFHDVKGRPFPQGYDERGQFLLRAVGGNLSMEPPKTNQNRVALVEYLIEDQGFDADYSGPRNERPLTASASPGVDYRIMETILRQGVNPNYDSRKPTHGQLNGLRKAFRGEQRMDDIFSIIDKAETLLLMRVAHDSIRSDDEDADAAYEEKHTQNAWRKLQLLLDHGADPLYENNDGYCALDYFQDESALRLGFVDGERSDAVHKILDEAARRQPNAGDSGLDDLDGGPA